MPKRRIAKAPKFSRKLADAQIKNENIVVRQQSKSRENIPFYQRLEPRCRDDDFSNGLEAQTADPLWFLTRQWQFGEFQGQDTGSPIKVSVSKKTQKISHFQFGENAQAIEIPEDGPPLEAMVENEHVYPEDIRGNWRLRVQIGQHLERILNTHLGERGLPIIRTFRRHYPIESPGLGTVDLDRETQTFLRFMAGKVLDGGSLYLDVKLSSPELTLPSVLRDELAHYAIPAQVFLKVLDRWFETVHGKLAATETTAWIPENLEYQFNVRTPANLDPKTTLTATSYRNGDLDWHTFSVIRDDGRFPESSTPAEEFIPTRVSFHGMPHPRWWAFEDSQTDFGSLEPATTDLAKLMIMNFALVYGNDWFIIPLPVEVATLTRIHSLKVTDTFGIESQDIPRARTVNPQRSWQNWGMFGVSHPTDPDKEADFLFLPPVVPLREESPPLEEVRFLRDEMANMVWGVEQTVLNGLGRPVSGFEAQMEAKARLQEKNSEENAPSGTDVESVADTPGEAQETVEANPIYRLASTVPANWIPYVPVRESADNPSIYLKQAEMLRNDDDKAPTPIEAMTRLLKGNALTKLREEAVTRAGQKYQLTRQRIRWIDGTTFVWTGRKVVPGKGEGSSGLRFDLVWPSINR